MERVQNMKPNTGNHGAIGQEPFENMSKRNLLETMTPIQLRELRVELLIKLSEAESDVHLINSILEDKGCE